MSAYPVACDVRQDQGSNEEHRGWSLAMAGVLEQMAVEPLLVISAEAA
jgi:hypothetical protein